MILKDLINHINMESHDRLISNFLNVDNRIPILSKGGFKIILTHLGITNDNVESLGDYTFISILNSDSMGDNIGYFEENKRNVLILKFDDVIDPDHGVLFTDDQSIEIINFISLNRDNILKGKCVIHCSAGVSRSGAVGTYLNRKFEFDEILFGEFNPNIMPNELVLDILNNSDKLI